MESRVRRLSQAAARLDAETDARVQTEAKEMAAERDLKKIDDDVENMATLLAWEAETHSHRPKGVWWYASVVGVAIVLGGAFWWLENLLAIGIVGLGAFLLILLAVRPPAKLKYRVMVHGIAIGNWLYHYTDLESFNIIYEPHDVKVLLIKGRRTLTPLLTLELGEVDPIQLRDMLLEVLPENLELEEPLPDILARRIGL